MDGGQIVFEHTSAYESEVQYIVRVHSYLDLRVSELLFHIFEESVECVEACCLKDFQKIPC